MQNPHVLQWLARGGLHMLHVEQYLRQKLASESKTQCKQRCKAAAHAFYVYMYFGYDPACMQDVIQRSMEALLTSPNGPRVSASSIALHGR